VEEEEIRMGKKMSEEMIPVLSNKEASSSNSKKEKA